MCKEFINLIDTIVFKTKMDTDTFRLRAETIPVYP